MLTYLAVQRSGLPWQRVLGLGTQLDTARFCSYISRAAAGAADAGQRPDPGRARRQHGADLVERRRSPACRWSNGPASSPTCRRKCFEDTKTSGAQVIKLKGGSAFAVGLSIREVVHALATDSRRILPVSSLQSGAYGIRDVCLSVPTVVGYGGVRQQIELELTPKEKMAMQNSAKVLRETIDTVEGAHWQGGQGDIDAGEYGGGVDVEEWKWDSEIGVAEWSANDKQPCTKSNIAPRGRSWSGSEKPTERRIADALSNQLQDQPTTPTRHRKHLRRLTLVSGRFGSAKCGLDVSEQTSLVTVVAIGYKERNRLFFRGQEYSP